MSTRKKPPINVGVISQIEHGKSTLTFAKMTIMSRKYGEVSKAYDHIDITPEKIEISLTKSGSPLFFAHLSNKNGKEPEQEHQQSAS